MTALHVIKPDREPDAVDLNEVARRLSIHPQTARALVNRGEIRGFKINKKEWRVRTKEIIAYITRLEKRVTLKVVPRKNGKFAPVPDAPLLDVE